MSTASESPFVQGVHLQRTDENVREIAALAEVAGEPTGLDGVLDDLKYDVRRSRAPRLLGRAVREAYRWDDYDERDEQWYPQGISTSADSSDTEAFLDRSGGGRRVVVATWYSTGRDGTKRGSRVTFVDLDSGKYRHVLLVSPVFDKAGNLVLKPMSIHAGGIVWAGPYLHIAATSRGFVTARVDDILRVRGDDDHPDRIGLEGSHLYSFGHRYVLPVRFTYQAFADEGHEKLRYSFMSLDRRSEPPALVAGEYASGAAATTRLARYPLDPQTWRARRGRRRVLPAAGARRGRRTPDAGRGDRVGSLPRDRLARPVDAGVGVRRRAGLDEGPPLGAADGSRGPVLLALDRPDLVDHRAPATALDRRDGPGLLRLTGP